MPSFLDPLVDFSLVAQTEAARHLTMPRATDLAPPVRPPIVDSPHKVTFMSPRGRIEKKTFEAWIGAVRCIGVDVLAYSPPPAAML